MSFGESLDVSSPLPDSGPLSSTHYFDSQPAMLISKAEIQKHEIRSPLSLLKPIPEFI